MDRARVRLFLLNFEKELFAHVQRWKAAVPTKPTDKRWRRRPHPRPPDAAGAGIFLKNKYMLGEDFSMLDVAIAPLLGAWTTTAST